MKNNIKSKKRSVNQNRQPNVTVVVQTTKELSEDKIKKIAGAIRGIYTGVNGYQGIADKTNEEFLSGKEVPFKFESGEKARAFQKYVKICLSKPVLEKTKIRRLYRKRSA